MSDWDQATPDVVFLWTFWRALVLSGNVNNLHCDESLSSDGLMWGLPCMCVGAFSSHHLATRATKRSEGLYLWGKVRERHMDTKVHWSQSMCRMFYGPFLLVIVIINFHNLFPILFSNFKFQYFNYVIGSNLLTIICNNLITTNLNIPLLFIIIFFIFSKIGYLFILKF